MDLLERVISCHFLFIKMMIPQIHAENFTKIVFLWWFCIFIGRGRTLNSSQSTISWKPLEPLLFNKDVTLKCFIKDCCPDDTQWTGGKTSSLLTLGRVSNNKAKYEESWGVDASYLKIKNFGIDDGDSLYTCFHGFSKHPKNLTIKGNNFALMPTEETLKKNVTVRNGYLNASVEFLKVYPEPVCNCTFKKLGITDVEHINVSSDFYPTASLFLYGRLHIAHQICHEECVGTIQIDCRIGKHAYNVFKTMVDIQFKYHQETKKDKEYALEYVLATLLAVLILVAVVCVLYKLKKKKDKAKNSIPEAVYTTELSENPTDAMLLTEQHSSDQNFKDYTEDPDACHKTNGSSGYSSSDPVSHANV